MLIILEWVGAWREQAATRLGFGLVTLAADFVKLPSVLRGFLAVYTV
jgi:hypothetical protein